MEKYTDEPNAELADVEIGGIAEEEEGAEGQETDTLLSESNDKAGGGARSNDDIDTGNGSSGDYDYPQHPLTEELACIPDMPGNFARVGKLYVCGVRNRDVNADPGRSERGVEIQSKHLRWTVGPCWPMLLCTYSLIVGISCAAYIAFLPSLPWIFSLGGITLLCIVVFALTKTACTNPGILPRVTNPPDDSWRWNDSAQSYVPPGATYCQESQVIVYDYDHFCPWTGTTIAGGNMSYFSCFVSSLGMLCVFVMFLTVAGSAASLQTRH